MHKKCSSIIKEGACCGRCPLREQQPQEPIDCLRVSSFSIDCAQQVDEWKSSLASRLGQMSLSWLSCLQQLQPPPHLLLNLLNIQFLPLPQSAEANKSQTDSTCPAAEIYVCAGPEVLHPPGTVVYRNVIRAIQITSLISFFCFLFCYSKPEAFEIHFQHIRACLKNEPGRCSSSPHSYLWLCMPEITRRAEEKTKARLRFVCEYQPTEPGYKSKLNTGRINRVYFGNGVTFVSLVWSPFF